MRWELLKVHPPNIQNYIVTRNVYTLNFVLWLGLGLSFVFMQLPGDSLFWSAMQNSGHSLGMCALSAFGILSIAPKFRTNFYAYLLIIISLVLLSILIEVAQSIIGRGASIEDLLLDFIGMIAGAFIAYAVQNQNTKLRCSLSIILACVLLIWCVRLPLYYFIAQRLEPALPLITKFEQFTAGATIRVYGAKYTIGDFSQIWPDNQSNSLEVNFLKGKWPSVHILEPTNNWSKFNIFTLEVFNGHDDAINLVTRLNEDSIDIPDHAFVAVQRKIQPGINTIKISFEEFSGYSNPNHRPTFKEVAAIIFYTTVPDETITLYFDNLRLE